MNIVRTIVWVLLLVALLLFSVANWDQSVEVQIWDNLVWVTKLPAVVVVSFLIGLVPMWLLHRATKWRLHRRISSLEASARAAAMANAAPPASTGADPALHRPADHDFAVRPGSDLDRSLGSQPQPRPVSDTGSGAAGTTARVDEFGPRDR